MNMRKSIIFMVSLALTLSVPITSFGATEKIKWIKVDGTPMEVSEGLVRVHKDDKSGYIDGTGKTVIPFIYERGYEFREGLASVKKDGKWGYIDKTGKEVITFIYEEPGDFDGGLAGVGKGEKENIKYGYIDKTGKEVIPFVYKHGSNIFDGVAFVRKNDDKYVHIDKTGKEILPNFRDRFIRFSEGLGNAKKDGKWGYIDKTGGVVIPFIYDGADRFSEGFASVGKDGKWGYIDKTGKVVIPFIYEYADRFSEGLASVKKDGKWSFIDKTGKEILKDTEGYFLNSLNIFSCKSGKLKVRKNGLEGLIDKKGNKIIEPIYDILKYSGDLVAVLKGKEWFVGSLKEEKDPVKEPIKIKDKKALSTTAKVLVNGKEIDFEAYNIDGNNYFKLRDLAKVVTGTEKQFEITWDQEKKAVNMISNKEYTAVGGELEKKDVKDEKATLSNSVIYKDGEKVDLKAYLIKGNNYFKLRDVAKAFDIGIGWDNQTKTITVDTGKSYE